MTRAAPVALGLAAGLALAGAHPPLGLSWLALAVPALLVAGWDLARDHGDGRTWPTSAVAAAVGHGLLLEWVVNPAGYVGWGLLVLVHVGWWCLLGGVVARVRWPLVRPLVVALAWVGIDSVRGVVPLNGFAWGTLGAAVVDLPWLAVLARLAGEKAMTLAVVLLSVGAWEAARAVLDATRDDTGRVRWDRVRDHAGAGTVGTAWLGGTALVVTLAIVEPPPPVGRADVLLVQPSDITSFAGTSAQLDEAIATSALALTTDAVDADGRPDVTVWPESTIDRDPRRLPVLGELRTEAAGLLGGGLLAGANLDGAAPDTFRNVLQSVHADGEVVDTYQKRSLVPFGEYVPFRDWLDWFPPLDQVPRDAVPGDGPVQLTVDDVRVAALICFETLFGDVLRGNVLAGDQPAQLVVAATNDASFGTGAEADQHIDQSRLRALETGRWVAHAAISGRSAFVDPDGGVHDRTDLFEATTLRRTVDLVDARTPFLVTGDWLAPTSTVALLGLAGFALRRRRDRSRA